MSESHFVHWTLAPGSWFLTPDPDTMFPCGGNRCLKMRAPFNVKDVGRLQHVNWTTTVAEIILSIKNRLFTFRIVLSSNNLIWILVRKLMAKEF